MGALATVTILFCDVVGSTAVATRLGDDVADQHRRDAFAAWRVAIEQFGGLEVKTTGDGMMAVFRSIVAALDCAVALQRITPVPGEGAGSIKVGISIGEAVEEDGDYYGTPVVEASRLCDACAPGKILANAAIQTLAGSRSPYAFQALGKLELKGLDPFPATEVMWEQGTVVPFPPMLTQARRTTFVGRRDQRGALERTFSEAPLRRVALLSGEPGVGKTRLAAEFAAWAHVRGAIVLSGRCDEGLGSPFQPWVQALEHLVTSVPRGALERACAGLSRVSRLAPSLTTPALDDGGGDNDRFLLFEAVDELLSKISDRLPLVLVLDDIQWADLSSLQLLRHVAASSRRGSVVILATYQDSLVDRQHPMTGILADLERHGTAQPLPVGGLEDAEVGELITSRTGETAPRDFLDAVVTRTAGNPFFATELLRHLAGTGAADSDGWMDRLDLGGLGLPRSVRLVVQRRLAQLSEPTEAFLSLAAVAGPQFQLDVLANAGDLSGEQATDCAEEAARSVLVTEEPSTPGRYAFTHGLVRQTLLEAAPRERRVRLHWRIGHALEAAGADVDAVAYHYVAGVTAGEVSTAVRTSLAAGRRAIARLAVDEALGHHRRALTLLDEAGWPDDALRADVLIGLGHSHLAAFDRRAAIEPLIAAADMARALGDTERFVRGALLPGHRGTSTSGDSPSAADLGGRFAAVMDEAIEMTRGQRTRERACLLANRGAALADTDPKRGKQMAAEGRDIARELGDPEATWTVGLTLALFDRGEPDAERRRSLLDELRAAYDAAFPGREMDNEVEYLELAEALRHGDRAKLDRQLEVYKRKGRPSAPDPGGIQEAAILVAEGEWSKAERRIKLLIEREREAAGGQLDPLTSIVINETLGDLMMLRGDFVALKQAMRPLLEAALVPLQWWGQLAVVEASLDDRTSALEAAGHVTDELLEPGLWTVRAIRTLAEAAVLTRDEHLAERLLPYTEAWRGQYFVTNPTYLVEGSADVAIGQCLTVLGRHTEAIEAFDAGIACEEGLGFHALATRSRGYMLGCLLSAGEVGRATELRDRCISSASAIGMSPTERRAREFRV